jgi:outer membrane protein OmpA-like peptidoglycan-associated protein
VALVIAAASVLTAACGMLAGPERPPHPKGALALVVGHRNNMPRPQLVGSHGQQVVTDSIRSQDTLYVIDVSGDPRKVYRQEMTGRCDSVASCDNLARRNQGVMGQAISQVKASSPEANTLQAIAVAAQSIAGEPDPKHIVVIDNGLQTTGEMPLQGPGALAANPDQVAQTLYDAGRLEKLLAGTDITLIGLGNGHAPQKTLSQHKLDQLKILWDKVLRKAGAANVYIESQPLSDEAPGEGLPAVSVVEAADDPAPKPAPCIPLREDQVGFLPESAEFRDAELARRALQPIAQKIIAEKITATLKGTTALPRPTGPGSLPDRRAQAVKNMLVSLGTPAESLRTVGLGTNFTGYVDPTAPDGVFKETVAVQDRLVIIELAGARC